jgi:hypothetical protein
MAVQLQLRRGSAAQWTAANTLLAQGELGLETDTGKLKIGDGSTAWTSLSYYTAGSAAVTSVNGYTGVVVLTASDISGLGTIASQAANNITITGGSITGITDLAVADGGTGASTASGARTNLGLVIGTDVLAPNGSAASLTSFPTLNQNTTGTASNVTGTVAVANGGTGATTASGARTNLGLVIGTDVLSPTGSAASLTSFPTFNQNTTGTASNVTGTVAIANGGTGATTAGAALTALGAYAASNPSGYTSNTGTVTSITAGTGLSGGTITSSGTVALANTAVTAGSYTLANITVDAQGRITSATNGSAGSGTVTSVGMTTPTGLSVSGSPVTTSGTLALSMTAGYAIPTTASQANWDTAYGWGNHASAGYLTTSTAASTYAPLTGTGTSGTWGISITGNAATATNVAYSGLTGTVPTWNQNTTGTAANVTGTVAVANGGTGATTASGARTNLGLVIGTDVLAPNGSAASLTSFPTLNQNTTGTASNVTGTVAIANGGTGQTTASAAFNALSPVTSTGDLIVGNGTNSSTRLGIGTNGYVLTSNGTTATWAAASGGSALTVKDEGATLSTAVTSFDFVGAGVVATNTGGAVTVTVAGGGGGTSSPIPKLQSWSIGGF